MDQILKRTVNPAASPVTLTESKADLRIQHTAEDDLIQSLIDAATDYLAAPNGAIGKAMITQTWELSVPFPDHKWRVWLPVTPVQSISSIAHFDGDNVEQSLTVDDFHLYGDEDWAYLVPKHDKEWPTLFNRLDALTVTFVAGFGDASTGVPNSIRQAIRMLVVHWFENRSAGTDNSVTELPLAVQSLIATNRKGWVA